MGVERFLHGGVQGGYRGGLSDDGLADGRGAVAATLGTFHREEKLIHAEAWLAGPSLEEIFGGGVGWWGGGTSRPYRHDHAATIPQTRVAALAPGQAGHCLRRGRVREFAS